MLGGLPLRYDLESLVSFSRKHAHAIANTMCVCQQSNSIKIYDGKLDFFFLRNYKKGWYDDTKRIHVIIPIYILIECNMLR